MRSYNRPWREAFLSAVLGSCTLVAGAVFAATPEPPGLLSNLPGKSQAVLPAQAIAGRARAVQINFGQLRSGRLFISLPDGVSFEAVRDHQQEWGAGRFDWVGHADGDQGNSVVIGISGNSVAGAFNYQGRLFKLEPRADGSHIVSEVETSDPAPELDPVAVADTLAGGTGSAGDAALAADGGGPVMDVLVAYTPSVQAQYGASGADALIIQAVAEANQAYANSGMTPRLNLVHTVLTGYTESGDMGTDLARLRSTSDGYMDELHALRDSYGADLVSLIENEPQYCGIAYRMASLSASFASSAFSVVHHSCATGYYSFAHELGHNQGAHHDHNNASGAIYPYAYGYQEPFNLFRTVMAYNCASNCTRIKYFSNPDVLFNGQPTGQANYADNALAIDNTAATVAAFRTRASQQQPPAAPSGLAATAASQSEVALDWADNSSDESGFNLERSLNALDFVQIASLPANTTSYLDNSLQADTLYSYRVRAWNSAGNSGYSQVATAATNAPPPVVDQLASADLPVAGTVTGNYQSTWSADGQYETIQERLSGGKASRRYGYLEHKWAISVKPGNSVVLYANVQTSTTADSFTFAYSTDNASFIDMFTVSAGSSGAQQFVLPASLNGTLYVRVRDNTRKAGQATAYSVQVDQLLVRSESSAGTPAPDAPDALSAVPQGTDQVLVSWVDGSDNESGFKIERQVDGSGPWTQVYVADPDTVSYQDTGLQPGTLYTYRAQAFNGGGASAYSNTDSALTDSQQSAGSIDLNARGYKVRGYQAVDLSWSGVVGSTVDIYRDGALLRGSVTTSGSYTDNINAKGTGTYAYEVCEAGSTTCSNVASVVF